jgi:hypothetical protein
MGVDTMASRKQRKINIFVNGDYAGTTHNFTLREAKSRFLAVPVPYVATTADGIGPHRREYPEASPDNVQCAFAD